MMACSPTDAARRSAVGERGGETLQARARLSILLAIVAAACAITGASTSQLDEAGRGAYLRGEFVLAERLFTEAIAKAPTEPLPHYHRAVVLTRLSRWTEAADEYRAVLRLRPSGALANAAREGLRTLAPLSRGGVAKAPHDEPSEPIPLKREGGNWLAEVVLNNSRTARFLVDTGASICVISPELARALQISPDADADVARLQTLSGKTTGAVVQVSRIRVGPVEAMNVDAVIHPTPDRMDGILGNTFLSRYLVSLDPKRGVLFLESRH